jgi:urease alpha subunit
MVRVEGEVEIHHFALKLERGRFVAGRSTRVGHSSKKSEERETGGKYTLLARALILYRAGVVKGKI